MKIGQKKALYLALPFVWASQGRAEAGNGHVFLNGVPMEQGLVVVTPEDEIQIEFNSQVVRFGYTDVERLLGRPSMGVNQENKSPLGIMVHEEKSAVDFITGDSVVHTISLEEINGSVPNVRPVIE